MKEFLNSKLNIAFDGTLNINEILAIAIVLVFLTLLTIAIVAIIRKIIENKRQKGTAVFVRKQNSKRKKKRKNYYGY